MIIYEIKKLPPLSRTGVKVNLEYCSPNAKQTTKSAIKYYSNIAKIRYSV